MTRRLMMLGWTYFHLAGAHANCRCPKEAAECVERCIQESEQSLRIQPLRGDCRHALALGHELYAGLFVSGNQSSDAESHYRRSFEVAQRLLSDYPDIPAYQGTYCSVLDKLTDFLAREGRTEDAVSCYRQAVTELEQLVARIGADVELHRLLAERFRNCHLFLLHRCNQPHAAEPFARKSLALYRKLTSERPEELRHRVSCAWLLHEVAACIDARGGDPQERELLYRELLRSMPDILADLALENLSEDVVINTRSLLVESLRNLALICTNRTESEALSRKSLAMSRDLISQRPDHVGYRTSCALLLHEVAVCIEARGGDRQEQESLYCELLRLEPEIIPSLRQGGIAAVFRRNIRYVLGLSLLNLARICADRDQPAETHDLLDRAVSHLEAAVALSPSGVPNMASWHALCRAYLEQSKVKLRLGNPPQARERFAKADQWMSKNNLTDAGLTRLRSETAQLLAIADQRATPESKPKELKPPPTEKDGKSAANVGKKSQPPAKVK